MMLTQPHGPRPVGVGLHQEALRQRFLIGNDGSVEFFPQPANIVFCYPRPSAAVPSVALAKVG
jgi:hypothetical protein